MSSAHQALRGYLSVRAWWAWYWVGDRLRGSEWVCRLMNRLDLRVHDDSHRCEWVAPYGFVVEAGCPRHD